MSDAGNSDDSGKKLGRPFKKGVSGNPSGRPKVAQEFKARCQKFVDAAVIALWENEVLTGGDKWFEASQLMAAYAHGKPHQAVGFEDESGKPITVTINLGDD